MDYYSGPKSIEITTKTLNIHPLKKFLFLSSENPRKALENRTLNIFCFKNFKKVVFSGVIVDK